MLDNITLVNSLSGIELSIINEEEQGSNDFIQLIDNKFTLYLYIKNITCQKLIFGFLLEVPIRTFL